MFEDPDVEAISMGENSSVVEPAFARFVLREGRGGWSWVEKREGEGLEEVFWEVEGRHKGGIGRVMV